MTEIDWFVYLFPLGTWRRAWGNTGADCPRDEGLFWVSYTLSSLVYIIQSFYYLERPDPHETEEKRGVCVSEYKWFTVSAALTREEEKEKQLFYRLMTSLIHSERQYEFRRIFDVLPQCFCLVFQHKCLNIQKSRYIYCMWYLVYCKDI